MRKRGAHTRQSAARLTRGVPAAGVAPTRGFWFMRDIPTALWLTCAALAAVSRDVIPAPRWLLIHLLLLGAATHLIFVWSQYFSYALLRSRASVTDRRNENVRLVLVNGAALMVLVGVPSGTWLLTGMGAAALILAVLWHGVSLVARLRRSFPGRYGHTVRYYVVSAALLAVGATLGALASFGGFGARVSIAHVIVNLFGWIGITIAGTVVTLWPTVLRTRADDGAAAGSARALPVLGAAIVLAATGALVSAVPLVAAGAALYLAGVIIIAVSLARSAMQAPPSSFAALSMGAGIVWWIASLIWLFVDLTVTLLTGSSFAAAARLTFAAVPFLVAGFVAQVIVGALSYLLPVVLGGGPAPVRSGATEFNRFAIARVATANIALLASAVFAVAPAPETLRAVAAVLYLGAMASFLPVMGSAIRRQRRAQRV